MEYKNFDEWFKWNCRGCRNIFECKKIRLLDKVSIPEKCKDRKCEW